jgi:hypothetical protein
VKKAPSHPLACGELEHDFTPSTHMETGNLAWLITKVVLCRKSTDLSWEGEEPSAAASEENRSPAVEESTPLP